MSVQEFISKGTGPNGSDEIKQVSTLDPMPSSAVLNGNVTQNISATSANSLTEDYDAIAESVGNYSIGDRLRKVVIYELDTDGGTRTHWYNVTTNVKLAAAPAANDVSLFVATPTVNDASPRYNFAFKDYKALNDSGDTRYNVGDVLRQVLILDDSDINRFGSFLSPSGNEKWFNLTQSTQFGVALVFAEVSANLEPLQATKIGGQVDYFVVLTTHNCVADAGTTFNSGDILRRTIEVLSDGFTKEHWSSVNVDGNVTTSHGYGLFPRISQIAPYNYGSSFGLTNTELRASAVQVYEMDASAIVSQQLGYDNDNTDCSEIGLSGTIVEGILVKNEDTTAKAYVLLAGAAFFSLPNAAARLNYTKENGFILNPGDSLNIPFAIESTASLSSSLVFCSDVAQTVNKSLRILTSYRVPVR